MNGNVYVLENESRSDVSTPVSINTSQQKSHSVADETEDLMEDTIQVRGVPHSGSKSLDVLDNLEEVSNIKLKQTSCSDIKITSKPFEQSAFYDVKDSNRATSASTVK